MNDNQEKSMNTYEQIERLQEQLDLLKQQINSESELPTMIDICDRAYSVGETPITVAQYQYYCTQTNQAMPRQPAPHAPTNPVVNVTFYDAQKYVTWLSEYTGESYNLPTEDGFEHCCGDHKVATSDIAVYSQDKIYPVKTKKPNKYGLYDMLGCVWEWQESTYVAGTRRVLRGGSWNYNRDHARAAYRFAARPVDRYDNFGFRVSKQKRTK